MAGMRLLDVAALFNASRAVASQHFSIRLKQLDVYSKTSTLAKTLRKQTKSTAQDLHPSGLRHSLNSHTASQQQTYSSKSGSVVGQIPSSETVQDTSQPAKGSEGLEQDHSYRPQDNAVLDDVPNGELNVRQEKAKRHPLPDGTIPPEKAAIGKFETDQDAYSQRPATEPLKKLTEQLESPSKSLEPESSGRSSIPDPDRGTFKSSGLSSKDARILQRRSESQIPSKAGEPPREEAYEVKASPSYDGSETGVNPESDTFYRAPDSASPVLSALPRFKLPKNVGDVQGGVSHLKEDVNADVFYSSGDKEGSASGSEQESSQGPEEPSEEMVNQIFHSPRVARILKSKGQFGSLKPKNTDSPRRKSTLARQGDDSSATNTRIDGVGHGGSKTTRGPKQEQDDITELAADIQKDAQTVAYLRSGENAMSSRGPFEMRESRVPSSRFGRMWQYGGLAASMAFGAAGESLKRATGSATESDGSLVFSTGNMERLVAKLSKMRGAALKLGQMMSFQDSKMLPKPIYEVLQRVQDSADYMPPSQRDSVLANELGSDWRSLFESFEEKPMAAASIGQVHGAILKSNRQRVAVKVQYPGVAASISSDLSNLSLLLTASRLLPKGLYLDKTIANARTELAWECDYIREADGAKRFKELLSDETDTFTVPTIYDEASGKQVLTMERMEGKAVTKIQDFSQEQNDWIGTQILRLCLREIMEFRYMQTDPNWTNFLYNRDTNRLELLDFGASREFPQKFMHLYIKNLTAASRKDRDACRELSIQLGYLTGYESQTMLNAHIDSVMTLAEPFMESAPEIYDFKDQTITDRVRSLIPVMIRERLAPPPEETYSLHRKLSGAFLLCARLGSRVKCKELFNWALTKSHAQRE